MLLSMSKRGKLTQKSHSGAQRTQNLMTNPNAATQLGWIFMIQVLKTVQWAVKNNPLKMAFPRNVNLHVKWRKNNPKIQQCGTENPKFDNKSKCSCPHKVDFHDSSLENCSMDSQKQSMKMVFPRNVNLHVKKRKNNPKIHQCDTENPKFDNKSK